MNAMVRAILAWLGVAVAIAIAAAVSLRLILACFDCGDPPPTWLLLAPWLLPAAAIVVALWISGAGRVVERLARRARRDQGEPR